MSSSRDSGGRAARGRPRRRIFVTAALVFMRGANPNFEVPRADRANFRKSVAALRAQLALAPAPKKARLLSRLDAVARRFR